MPVVTVMGVPQGARGLYKLRIAIKKAIASIEALGLQESQITVFFPVDQCDDHNNFELIAMVSALFDSPARTPNVRTMLANALLQVLLDFVDPYRPACKFIEVLIDTPFNPEIGISSWRTP